MIELDEKYGITEFENVEYKTLVENIVKQLSTNKTEKEVLVDLYEDCEFNKIEIDFSKATSWLETLTIFYNIDNFKELHEKTKGYSIVLDQLNKNNGTIIEEKTILDNGKTKKINYIKKATIFVFVDKNKRNFEKFYLKVLYHELGHLYTNRNLNIQHLENKDLINYFKNNVNEYVENINNLNFSIENIYDIFTYCMYYCNLSESHAFMETINFEMQSCLNNPAMFKRNLGFLGIEKTNENMFYHSSTIMQIYYNLNELLKYIKETTDIFEQTKFDEKYKDEIKQIYGKTIAFNKLISKYLNTINHVIDNSRKIYNYYSDIYKLNVDYILEHCFAENFDHNSKYLDLSEPLYE